MLMKVRVRKDQTRPIIGCERMPEWPEYVEIPAHYEDAMRDLIERGVCEYAPRSEAEVAPSTPSKIDRKGFVSRRPVKA